MTVTTRVTTTTITRAQPCCDTTTTQTKTISSNVRSAVAMSCRSGEIVNNILLHSFDKCAGVGSTHSSSTSRARCTCLCCSCSCSGGSLSGWRHGSSKKQVVARWHAGEWQVFARQVFWRRGERQAVGRWVVGWQVLGWWVVRRSWWQEVAVGSRVPQHCCH